uniref:Uncharacterized protein n=1 Tax=Ciona savignyi TaxID=51511 RepID=H2Z0S3_CIOSA
FSAENNITTVPNLINEGKARRTKGPEDLCDDKLCTNIERDKKITFIAPPYPTTTTFPWTTTMSLTSTPLPEIPCVKEIDIQLEEDDEVTIRVPTDGSGALFPNIILYTVSYLLSVAITSLL